MIQGNTTSIRKDTRDKQKNLSSKFYFLRLLFFETKSPLAKSPFLNGIL